MQNTNQPKSESSYMKYFHEIYELFILHLNRIFRPKESPNLGFPKNSLNNYGFYSINYSDKHCLSKSFAFSFFIRRHILLAI